MQQYKKDFIDFLVKADALKFGSFKLKSGRMAPYFINMGSFHTGEHLYALGKFYAAALLDSGVSCDVIFGPAYKGIPLSVITTAVLHKEYGKNISYSFNRKVAKEYGMKDLIIGASLAKETKVFLIDDVITAGTAVRESVSLLKENGDPKLVGILIAVDRMEKNNEGVHAIQAIEKEFDIPVFSIVNLDDIVLHLKNTFALEQLEAIQRYRAQYGV